jgi:hypothetical protein
LAGESACPTKTQALRTNVGQTIVNPAIALRDSEVASGLVQVGFNCFNS